MLAGDASYLESTMLRGIVDGVSPDEEYRTGDARRHPRIVCRASDDLFADARPEVGRAAPRTTRCDHRRSRRRRSRISLVDD